jgi:hypothetical protein
MSFSEPVARRGLWVRRAAVLAALVAVKALMVWALIRAV